MILSRQVLLWQRPSSMLDVACVNVPVSCVQDALAELQVENEALGKITLKQTTESQRIENLEQEISTINSNMDDKVGACCTPRAGVRRRWSRWRGHGGAAGVVHCHRSSNTAS